MSDDWVASTHPLYDPHVPAWMDEGLCAHDARADEWFPNNGVSGYATQVCMRCPVMKKCGDYAQAMADEGHNPVGIWGGHTAVERRKRKRTAA